MNINTTVANNGVKILTVTTPDPLADYQAAMVIADKLASEHLGEAMLLSWYDRDRDFESLQRMPPGQRSTGIC